jgi:hypothetical protein
VLGFAPVADEGQAALLVALWELPGGFFRVRWSLAGPGGKAVVKGPGGDGRLASPGKKDVFGGGDGHKAKLTITQLTKKLGAQKERYGVDVATVTSLMAKALPGGGRSPSARPRTLLARATQLLHSNWTARHTPVRVI